MESADELQVVDDGASTLDDPIAPGPRPTYPSILQSFGLLLIFIICSIVSIPLLMFAQLDGELAMLCYYLAAMGLSFAIAHAIRERKLGSSTYCFRIDSWKLVLPLALTSAALLFGIIGPLVNLIPMPEGAGEGFGKLMTQVGPLTFLYFVIAAPILEELLFRGIVLDGLLRRYNPLTAILVSSLIFGLAHMNPWQFVTAFILGCFMGWVYMRTWSVGPCILIHMTANFCGYLVRLAYYATGIPDQTTGTDAAWGPFMIVPVICLLVIVVSVRYLRQEFDRLAMTAAGEIEVSVA